MKKKSQQAGSFGKALGQWVNAGAPVATDQQITFRRLICGKCDFWDQAGYAGTGACRKCTCAMAIKIRIGNMVCPLGKW